MWPHVYVICACLVFLSVGDLLVNSLIFVFIGTRISSKNNQRASLYNILKNVNASSMYIVGVVRCH